MSRSSSWLSTMQQLIGWGIQVLHFLWTLTWSFRLFTDTSYRSYRRRGQDAETVLRRMYRFQIPMSPSAWAKNIQEVFCSCLSWFQMFLHQKEEHLGWQGEMPPLTISFLSWVSPDTMDLAWAKPCQLSWTHRASSLWEREGKLSFDKEIKILWSKPRSSLCKRQSWPRSKGGCD